MLTVKIPTPPALDLILSQLNEHLQWICHNNEEKSKSIYSAVTSSNGLFNEFELRQRLAFVLPDENLDFEDWKWILPRLEWLDVPHDAWYISIEGALQISTEKVVKYYSEQKPLQLPDEYMRTALNMSRLCELLNTFSRDPNCWSVTLELCDYGWKVETDSKGKAYRYDFKPEVWLWYKAVEYNRAKNKKPADDR